MQAPEFQERLDSEAELELRKNGDLRPLLTIRRHKPDFGVLDGIPGIDENSANFGLSHERMLVAKPDAIVMHPGPMNRGIEIEGALTDSPQSVITEQVTNGVAIRIAVLEHVCQGML